MTSKEKFEQWLKSVDKKDTLYEELIAIENNQKEIDERFGSDLNFGTAGLRGIMGAGTNRINVWTIRKAALGVANYVKNSGIIGGVVIGYDTRKNSFNFAKIAAEVIATQNIKVHLFKSALPLSLLSFATRELKCAAGVMITASHNPKEYNGFKVFNASGGQVTTQAKEIEQEFEKIVDMFKIEHRMFNDLYLRGKIVNVPNNLYDNFILKIIGQRLSPVMKRKLKIVYSPLCGTGVVAVPDLLRRLGFSNVFMVDEHCVLDGEFSACPSPNPDRAENLVLPEKLAQEVGADIIIATDPDADRIVLCCKTEDGYYKFKGEELGAMITEYVLSRLKDKGKLNSEGVVIKSVVTSDLGFAVAKNYGISTKNILVGFKYVGEILDEMEKTNSLNKFVYAYEESCGGLYGTASRDKDALILTMLMADMCQELKLKRKDAYLQLLGLYKKYGYYGSKTLNLEFKGIEGGSKMNGLIANLRSNPLEKIGGFEVEMKDYEDGIDGLPSTNMLEFGFGGNKVVIRPSGTEPLLRVHVLTKTKTEEESNQLIETIEKEMKEYFKG